MSTLTSPTAAAEPTGIRALAKRLTPQLDTLPTAAAVAIFVGMIVYGEAAYGRIVQFNTLSNLLINNAHLIILAVGLTFVIVTGGIDLSVGAVIAISSVAGVMLINAGWNPWLAMLLMVLIGTAFGTVSGILIQYFHVQPFIATLAMMFLGRGLASMLSTEPERVPDESPLRSLGEQLKIYDGPKVNDIVLTPGVLIAAAVVAAAFFMLHRTRTGRTVYAIGGSEQSAALMGLPVAKTKMSVYIISGSLAGLAAVVYTARLGSAQNITGIGWELDAIAATVIGGTLLTGGAGFVLGSVVGALVLGLMNVLITRDGGIPPEATTIITGGILLVFVLLQRGGRARRRAEPRPALRRAPPGTLTAPSLLNDERPLMRTFLRPAALGVAAALTLGAVVTASPASAAAPSPLLHYSFDEAPADGVTIADASGNGNDGVLRQSGAAFTDGVLSLPGGSASGSAAFVEIPTDDLEGLTDVTVSTWVSDRSGAANVAAAFVGAPVASGASYSSGYWLLNPSNLSGYVKSVVTNTENASAPWGTEVGAGATGTPTAGVRTPSGMALYTTVIDGTNGKLTLFVNGVKTTEHAIARDVSSFGADLVAYLGRSTYRDAYFAGDFDDFTVYGSALSDADAQALYAEGALDRAVASVDVGGTADADFALPTTAYGAQITWASDDPAIAVDGGAAAVHRPEPGSGDAVVTLTATFTAAGATRTVSYTVIVPEDLTDDAKAQADLDAVSIANAADVRTNVSVPTTGAEGSAIEWTLPAGAPASLRDGAAAGTRTIVVERPAPGGAPVEVVATATARLGDAVRTKDFTLTLQPLTADAEDEAYVWAFFTGEGDGAERVSLAASRGNDALSWNTLNDGQPLFTSDQGTQGLRDPFILRSAEGDRFYMLATDLKVAGLAGGFDAAQRTGSLHMEVWESNDLVNWSAQRHVKVSSDFAGNTWAPEAYWDEELDTYVVYWASNLYDTTDPAARTAVTYNRMMYATTDDFVHFSEAKPWVDVKRGTGRGTIDATIAQVDGTYYRFIKDEASMTIRQERSDDLLATVTGSLPGTTGAADEWTLVKDQVATGLPNGEPGGTFTQGEGPSVFPANEGDVNGYEWYLFIDQPNYHAGPNYYIPFATNDIANGNAWEPVGSTLRENLPQNADGGKPRHGTVIPVSRAEYEAVLAAFAPDLAVASADPISVTTESGTAPVLPGAHLTKADGSQEDAAVEWDAIDPAQYAQPGAFTVSGVAQDDSRAPVTATVTVTAPLAVTVSTRCLAGKASLVVRTQNDGDTPLDVALSSSFGGKAITALQPGAASSVVFTTRQAAVPAGQVTATADGSTVTAAYAAATC